MMTLVALVVTTFLMPQPASVVTMPVAAAWSSDAAAGLSVAASRPLDTATVRSLDPLPSSIAPVRLRPVGSGLVATIGFAALSFAMVDENAAAEDVANGFTIGTLKSISQAGRPERRKLNPSNP
jgi:hypothetical protein